MTWITTTKIPVHGGALKGDTGAPGATGATGAMGPRGRSYDDDPLGEPFLIDPRFQYLMAFNRPLNAREQASIKAWCEENLPEGVWVVSWMGAHFTEASYETVYRLAH